MKKLYFLIFGFCAFFGNAQIINFPDPAFKTALLSSNGVNNIAFGQFGFLQIDANNDGEIQVSEAQAVYELHVDGKNISNLAGIENFVNLRWLDCDNNQILGSLDCSAFHFLERLWIYNNGITALNLQGTENTLVDIECGINQIASLDIHANTTQSGGLELFADSNPLTDISLVGNFSDISLTQTQLSVLDLSQCIISTPVELPSTLISVNIKNGIDDSSSVLSTILLGLNLQYLCTDDSEAAYFESITASDPFSTVTINSYCNFNLGGISNEISGSAKYDIANDGCDNSDISLPLLKYSISDGTNSGQLASNFSGNYSIPVPMGSYTLTPITEYPQYFTFSPTSATIDFNTASSPFTQNFCMVANGTHPDLEITLIPLNAVLPGFNAVYKIVCKNNGTMAQSATVAMNFDDSLMDFVYATPINSNQTTNVISWDLQQLQPFESREIILFFNINSPTETPAVNSGDVLTFNAVVNGAFPDETIENNTSIISQTALNSFDPNDKVCTEGNTITPEMVGKDIHYVIRFENTGTFAAQNIVVKDIIDTDKFDISTLVPMSASHNFYTRINGSKVEFIFENINLPFAAGTNDGYIAFKIKTKATLVAGDSFSNTANIYFDYNAPIITNTATTNISILATKDFEFANYFTIYPNPANDVLNIQTKGTISVTSASIYNLLGQLVLTVPNSGVLSKIDVSELKSGNYFIKINSDKGSSNAKFIKR